MPKGEAEPSSSRSKSGYVLATTRFVMTACQISAMAVSRSWPVNQLRKLLSIYAPGVDFTF